VLAPVVELALRGHLGFKSSLLDVNRLRDEIREEFRPLLSMVRNHTLPLEYAIAAGLSEHISGPERERRVIEDLIGRDARFRDQAAEMTVLILEAKRLALSDEDPAKIADLIAERLAAARPATYTSFGA
jgi:hypothetical protein